MKLRLHHYWRSSSNWRVRWAFKLKGIVCEYAPVDLLSDEPEGAEHLARNPLGYVPVLEQIDEADPARRYLCESLAIIEWAEETHPQPSLLPGDPWQRARIRMLAEVIASDTQPLQNLGPQELHSTDPGGRKSWARHWIRHGLHAYEKLAAGSAGNYSVGDAITLADLCLIPQCYNAERYGVDLGEFPTVARIHAAALETEACRASAPDQFAPADRH
jgi:maleylacetoacetate isomerase